MGCCIDCDNPLPLCHALYLLRKAAENHAQFFFPGVNAGHTAHSGATEGIEWIGGNAVALCQHEYLVVCPLQQRAVDVQARLIIGVLLQFRQLGA
ncbi:hypothetical protein LFZ49_01250 [Salmonella enterica subsp. arizonae serovar 62:z36:- str. 5335/86]|nr:hypothetical protein N898_13140 [Salmonella enterica subsp. arizonae serovar 62:z36:- str. RKS2983]KSB75851.1 hypothetical protein LFZ49_01250 [Salmonella enterica subsp. arizonae serovar 62:z36:- str. 5335/86]KSB77417.1 hypothetical protein LFZ51_17580 [Salmonella enterica subsp. arizonae serovar 63:g,z51:- str. So 20/20]